ncbi:MAG: MBL fold metallo-hydrolase [Opitutaceae bacterium]|nr:MBL fold metallo-hydrolase [Cytophagales bacterium]
MSLFVASLNSGSNGNCYYVGNDDEAILIDAGISCRETETRLKRLGLDIHKIKAIFISHEHADHISGVCVLVKKYNLPLYITPRTLQNSNILPCPEMIRNFDNAIPVVIGNLRILAFQKLHDAADPHSFVVSNGNVFVGVFTDIGAVCPQVIHHFKSCNAVFLESNYDEEMLETGHYPYHLKKRISGGKGHISNREAFNLFKEYKSKTLSHLFLSHLSNENNSPALVEKLFEKAAGETEIIIASRFKETALYNIKSAETTTITEVLRPEMAPYFPIKKSVRRIKVFKNEFQLSLFE